MLSKTLSTSKRWANLHRVDRRLAEFAQSFYPLLIAHADDFGRLPGDVFTVKHVVNPTSPRKDVDFDQALYNLTEVELIRRYQVDGKIYIEIVEFDDHQSGLHKRTNSKFPGPPETSGKFREFPSELKGTERNRTEEKTQDQEPRAERAPRAMARMDFAEVRNHLLAAAHLQLDANPDSTDGDVREAVKTAAAKLNAEYDGRSIATIVDAAIARRARRRA